MIIFGTKFFAWGSLLTANVWHCSKCGHQGQFIQKKGMNFFTLYWIIPVFPISKIKEMVQCPNCKAKYENDAPNAGQSGPSNGGSSPYNGPFSN